MEKPIPVGRLCLRLTDPQISLKKILLSQLNPKLHVLFFVSTFALDTKRFPQWTYFPLFPLFDAATRLFTPGFHCRWETYSNLAVTYSFSCELLKVMFGHTGLWATSTSGCVFPSLPHETITAAVLFALVPFNYSCTFTSALICVVGMFTLTLWSLDPPMFLGGSRIVNGLKYKPALVLAH